MTTFKNSNNLRKLHWLSFVRIYEQKQHQTQKSVGFHSSSTLIHNWFPRVLGHQQCKTNLSDHLSVLLILNEYLIVPSRNNYLEGYSFFVIFPINFFCYFRRLRVVKVCSLKFLLLLIRKISFNIHVEISDEIAVNILFDRSLPNTKCLLDISPEWDRI